MTARNALHANFLSGSSPHAAGARTASAILRGVQRVMRQNNFESLAEFPLGNGRRADVVAIGPVGEIHIIEIKSCLADFTSDRKWPEYRDYCDEFSFAVTPAFPIDVLPIDVGLLIADGYGGDVARPAAIVRIAPARRRAMMLAFARTAALRLNMLCDPSQTIDKI